MLAGGTAGLTPLRFRPHPDDRLARVPRQVANWREPRGLASLWVEGMVLVLSVYKVVTTLNRPGFGRDFQTLISSSTLEA
jgi:hypothetical protein